VIENSWWMRLYSQPAQWGYIRNVLYLQGTVANTPETRLMHELTHMLDDYNDWYLYAPGGATTNLREIEGLGYVAEHIFERLERLQDFENQLKGGQLHNQKEVGDAWYKVWGEFGRGLGDFGGTTVFVSNEDRGPITDADMSEFKQLIGVNISQSAVFVYYDDLVRAKVPGAVLPKIKTQTSIQ
jgi:hypothetical protein